MSKTSNIFQLYKKQLWIYIGAILLITGIFFIVINHTNSINSIILKEIKENATHLSNITDEIENYYTKQMNLIIKDKNSSYEDINEQNSILIEHNKYITGYIQSVYVLTEDESKDIFSINENNNYKDNNYKINTDFKYIQAVEENNSYPIKQYLEGVLSVDTKNIWVQINNNENNKKYIAYIIPIYQQSTNRYVGFTGVILNIEDIKDKELSSKSSYNNLIVLQKNNKTIYSDNEDDILSINDLLEKNEKKIAIWSHSFKEDNSRLLLNIVKDNNSFDYIEIIAMDNIYRLLNSILLSISLFLISIVILFYPQQKSETAVIDLIVNKLSHSKTEDLDTIKQSNQRTAIIIFLFMEISILVRCFYQLFAYGFNNIIYYDIAILFLIIMIIYSYIIIGVNSKIFNFLFVVIFLLPFATALIYAFNNQSNLIIIWSFAIAVLAILIFNRKRAMVYFNLHLIVLILFVIIQMAFMDDISNIRDLFYDLLNLFLFGSALFGALDAYVVHSVRNYNRLQTALEDLTVSHKFLAQSEKMASLGQLIFGIAHEINTPMGAIKASCENVQSATERIFRALINNTRLFSQKDIDNLITLILIYASSVREMRSTIEVRKAKKILKEYFDNDNFVNGDKIVQLLIRLELCDLEKIENNIDIFKNKKIIELLNTLLLVSPLIMGTETIFFATNKITKIVFALKSYSHTGESEDMTSVDVVKNIENILVLYHNQIKYGVEVIKKYDKEDLCVKGIPGELGQVWTNIIHNALQAMSGVGTLKIIIKEMNDECAMISFSDTGVGISEENKEKIFEAFYTTKEAGEGSGLGLSLCKKVIEKHNGEIKVYSKVGAGTTFTILLPIFKETLKIVE